MTLLECFDRPNRRVLVRHAAPRMPAMSLFCVGILLLGVALALAQTAGPSNDPAEPAGEKAVGAASAAAADGPLQKDDRLREGTELVDQPGSFRMTGDRITFFTDLGKGRLVALENLALERVGRTIEDNPSPPEWLVTGVITEYRGENLLFIQRAVLRNRATE